MVETPGCYGSVLSFSSEDETCGACPFNESCGEKSYEATLKMRELVNVSEFEKRFNIDRVKSGKTVVNEAPQKSDRVSRRSKFQDYQLDVINDESLPVKPRKMISAIFHKGFDGEYLLSAARAGINPYREQKPVILEKAFDLLLSGGFVKSELHRTYMEMGMSKRTAHSQVSIVVATLFILNVTQEIVRTGKITLKENQ